MPPADRLTPLNVYGKSKLVGEQAMQKAGGAYLILRTRWDCSMDADSFVTKVLGWARQNETLRPSTLPSVAGQALRHGEPQSESNRQGRPGRRRCPRSLH
ncbi:MAG: sugar nucleotide-binding protein [bacterium]|nr:sugar nucleotide-binding protein [bacterium]